MRAVRWLIGLWLLGLMSCGGSGGGGGAANPPPPPPPPPPPGTPPFGIDTRPSFTGNAIPTTDPTGTGNVTIARVFPNLSFAVPIFFAGVPGEARNVVVEKDGRVRVFANDQTANASTVVLDITADTVSSGETGLLGLAFDPNFATNRAFYLHYTPGNPLRSRISRFIWDAATDRAARNSEHVLLEVAQPFSNHNAGMLAFGPDGRLYIAFGDGGSGGDPQNNGQNRMALLGKLLRVAPPVPPSTAAYAIPADNPFVGRADTRGEIWALGFRNPFRFSFDRDNGDLWLGDVGQNAIEEIDVVARGGNYGWRVFEGTRVFASGDPRNPPYVDPVQEYDHSLGNAVIGGYVYRGVQVPGLFGAYLYGDNGSGRVWALTYDGTRVTTNNQIGSVSGLTSFGEDTNGEVRAVSGAGQIFGFSAGTGGTGNAPPALLSQTGIFTSLSTLSAANGVIEYSLNHPFWSDGAGKRRWFAVPNGQRITFSAAGNWQFPVGSVLVKHFEIGLAAGTRRLETRVLARRPSGWYGLVYRWRADGSEADLIADRQTEPLTVGGSTFDYEYPARTDCLRCHNTAAGSALGLRTGQMNRTFAYSAATDNQLRTLNHIQLFDSDIGAATQYASTPAIDLQSASVGARARAYLEVNCAVCHQPNGGAPVDIDLRAATALNSTNALNAVPQAGDLGIAGAAIIAAGSKERSVLWERMRRVDGNRMPPVASHRVDADGVSLVGSWIDSL